MGRIHPASSLSLADRRKVRIAVAEMAQSAKPSRIDFGGSLYPPRERLGPGADATRLARSHVPSRKDSRMNTKRSTQNAKGWGNWISIRLVQTSLQAGLLTVLLCAGASSSVLAQETAAAPASGMTAESRRLATLLIKNTLVAVNQANLTGNYTVLRDLSTPGFRQLNSAADLGTIFANLRQNKIDLSPIVLMDPVITAAKFSKEQKQLRLKGHFPSEPVQVEFELIFQQAEPAGWVIHGISVGTTKAGAASNLDPADAEQPAAAAPTRPAVRPASNTKTAPAATGGTRPRTAP